MEVKKEIEIKNLDLFKINMQECDIVYSSDLLYALLYNEGMIAVVDISNKEIISKFTNEKNCRLSKVKFSQNNITYINKKPTHSEVVINNLKFIGQYYEYRIDDSILDYISFDEYLFIVTISWQLYTVNGFENNRRLDIIKDSQMSLTGLNIAHMEMIVNGDNRNMVIILNNGSILNYRIIGDECVYDDIIHVESFGKELDRKYLSKKNNFNFVNMLQSKFSMNYDDYEMKNFGLEKLDINEDQVNNGIFFALCYSEYETVTNSYISFFEVRTCLIYLNRIKIENFNILDSHVYQAGLVSRNVLPDYLILCGERGDKIEIMYSDYFQCFKNDFSGFKIINTMFERKDKKLKKTNILSAYLTHNTISEEHQEDDESVIEDMNVYRDQLFTLNVMLRRLEIRQYNLCVIDFEMKEINNDYLSLDVNQYLEKFKSNPDTFRISASTFLQKSGIVIKEDNSDRDNPHMYYILLLIHNNNLFGLKNLLSRKEISGQYLIPNDLLFSTANNIYYNYLKKQIYQMLNKNIVNYYFFVNDRLLKNLRTILEIFKISKRRNQSVYHTPFPTEKDIIFENAISITKLMEEIEKTILIIKIIRSFTKNITLKQEKEETLDELFNNLHKNLCNRKRDRILFFELIMLSNYKEIYPFWKILFLNFFMKNDSENKNEPDGEIIFYFSKLQLFFYFYYVVSDYLNYSIEDNFDMDNRCDIRSFFSEMNDEFEEYADISNTLYKLDRFDPEVIGRENVDMNILAQLLKYLSGQNFIQNVKINDLIVNNFHITFVSMLKKSGYIKEAIELSKNMNYGEADIFSHISVLLELDLYHLAYQFVNFTFFNLVSSGELNAGSIEMISQSKGYSISKKLYFVYFESAIRNNQIEYLLCLPFNFIENSFFKEFLSQNKEYDEILFLYNVSIRNLKEAENCYRKIPDIEAKAVYRNILVDFKKLYGETAQTESKYSKYDNSLKIDFNLNKQTHRTKIVSEIRNPESSMLMGIIF
jgi:hypothetical protein